MIITKKVEDMIPALLHLFNKSLLSPLFMCQVLLRPKEGNHIWLTSHTPKDYNSMRKMVQKK